MYSLVLVLALLRECFCYFLNNRTREQLVIFITSCAALAGAGEKSCRLLSVTGDIQVRRANALAWEPATVDRELAERETIRSGEASTARLLTFDGSVFTLPPNTQFEIHELRRMSRNEIVLELTAIELQKLPVRKVSPEQPQNVFILHGAMPDSAQPHEMSESRDYIQREERGALALFAQDYLAGFVLKWNRLLSAFPEHASQPAEIALIRAYRHLDMPFRLQQALKRFKQYWPNERLPD
jgi:hypothetical protein